MAADLGKRALARAAEILGGSDRLAAYLQTDLEQLQRWSRGAKPPPVRVLHSLAKVLTYRIVASARKRRN